MKKITLVLGILILTLACKNNKTAPIPFTSQMLPNQYFTINTEKDTVLETVHGSVINIVAGSFNAAGNIQIQIKEAFTAAEILAAGLITESNGRPLRSAGMIYINALLNDKALQLIKPIKISMPNTYYDPGMKVFKGVETDSGTVNWIDPVAADTTPQANNWQVGKTLFRAKCTSCHNIFKSGTGPALKDVEYRGPWHDRKNLYSFIKNPAAYMSNDKYTQNLKSAYGSMMTAFPDLSIEATAAIFDFIKNESVRPGALEDEKTFNNSTGPVSLKKDTSEYYLPDSLQTMDMEVEQQKCGDDTIYIPIPKQNNSFIQTTNDNVSVELNAVTNDEPGKPEELEGLRNGFNDPNPTDGMYDFEIRTMGWYNIDAYVEGYAGTTNVKLTAQIRVDFDITMHVYLFCPNNKMLSVGQRKQNGDYFFDKINNGIPLFINERAILFAFGSKDDKMYYGISEFNVQGEQTIVINVKQTTADKIIEALNAKEINGVDVGIEKKETKIIKRDCDPSVKKDTVSKMK